MNPKVFVIHASEDKAEFVIPFATRLRSEGVDAWVDEWEMTPGDRIIDKIFNEGIRNAKAFIIVLSKHSTTKPWVREELDASFVKRISDGSKIIPVLIDDCDVPECLKSTLWQRIQNVNSYDLEFAKISNAIFETHDKPALGETPKYLTSAIHLMPSLTRIDSIVLKMACDLALASGNARVTPNVIIKGLKEQGITDDDIVESIEILDRRGYVKATQMMNLKYWDFTVTTYGFEQYAMAYIKDYESIIRSVALEIVNNEDFVNGSIAEAVHQPIMLVNHIIQLFAEKGFFVSVAKSLSGTWKILGIASEMKRWIRSI